MNFNEFKAQYRFLPIIPGRTVVGKAKAPQSMCNQLSRWQKKGLIIQLKRGVYLLNEIDRKINPGRFFLANQLLWPSYVSMESALSYYGLIPEAVADITSVTTKKTSRFTNKLGRFVYQHVQPAALRGYRSYKDISGLACLIAEPEKAVVDFLYLNLRRFREAPQKAFRESYRFQNVESLKPMKIIAWTRVFDNARLQTLAREFCGFIKEERA